MENRRRHVKWYTEGAEGEQPRRRRRNLRWDAGTRGLVAALGILCVVLVAALVGQEYYFSHTYQKGELAKSSQGEVKQRRKFMTEAQEEGAQGSQTGDKNNSKIESDGNTSGEGGSVGAAVQEGENETAGAESGTDTRGSTADGTDTKDDTKAAGGNQAEESKTAQPKAPTVVETSESVYLKNQLTGILPGIHGPGQTAAELIDEADRLAAMYDYDAAVELLKNCSVYSEEPAMQEAVAGYEASRGLCREFPVDQVTHIFFHTLIKDPKKAFDGDQYESGYNQYMVTISEFNSIIQQMYENGYVLVMLKDMVPAVGEGTGSILLPEGKKPFVLSQDDVSYYHYMDGDGFASRLIVDENGDIKNEYIEDDGSISVGDYDMIPLIDRFVEKHPDFSYRGAKGYVALTGYDGILGYRTDDSYKTRENLDSFQEQFFQQNPDFDQADFEWECSESRKVAEAIKEKGWEFASHTWGHVGLGPNSTTMEQFKADTDKWETRVEPLIGETDTLIYAFGGDISGVEEYSGERYEYLKSMGFDYFCGVDSAKYWVQIRDGYVRQGRRNVDGYRMYYNPDMLSDLFDVSKAWDPLRPAYVPPI